MITRSTTINGFSRRPRAREEIRVSFEFFPPANEMLERQLNQSFERLSRLEPDFISVTYGAGGSTRERTLAAVARLAAQGTVSIAGHLTCIDAPRQEVCEVIGRYHEAGIRHIVALRGDPKAGAGTRFRPHPEGYLNAAELTAAITAYGGFDVSVAAYPEKHPESRDFATDIDMLKRKVDNGATRAITQFCFDNDVFEAYVERVRKAGIYIPVVPGILPIHDFWKVAGFAARCGASIPQWLADRFDGLQDDPDTASLIASAVAAEQVNDLVGRGFEDFHFYTMNRADLSYAICHMLGLRPQGEIPAAA